MASNIYKLTILFLIIILTSTFIQATSINLLAASEEGNRGSLASAELYTQEGSGKIFIEANVLSKEDTQLSIRLAKEFICSNYVVDCTTKDFFYKIESNSQMISGPSGGAALALLTYAHLRNLEIPKTISLSGTINSGGYIGTVGGLDAKIKAAGQAKIKTVFIPIGNAFLYNYSSLETTINTSEKDNQTINKTIKTKVNVTQILNDTKIDLKEMGKNEDVQVIEIGSFDELLYYIYKISLPETTIKIPEFYTQTMKSIANDLCTQVKTYQKENEQQLKTYYSYEKSNESNNKNNTISNTMFNNSYETNINSNILTNLSKAIIKQRTNFTSYKKQIQEFINESNQANQNENFYAAASYCFSANLKIRYIKYLQQEIKTIKKETKDALNQAKASQKETFETLNDIQVYAVVQERLKDAQNSFEQAEEFEKNKQFLEAIDQYAYATERAKTASSWATFYNISDTKKIGNTKELEKGCSLTITEAKLRNQYLQFYIDLPQNAQESLTFAKEAEINKDYPLCIFYALRAKAETDAMASVLGLTVQDLNVVLNTKERIASQFVQKQYNKGQYPILGYSYLEYGSSLKNQNEYSSLIYFQMAQELSNLDVFLDTKEIKNNNNQNIISTVKNQNEFFKIYTKQEIFILGFAIGLLLSGSTIYFVRKKKAGLKKKVKKKTK